MAKDIDRAIELLECAKINCDNTMKMGAAFVEVVKMQITEALMCLEDEEE